MKIVLYLQWFISKLIILTILVKRITNLFLTFSQQITQLVEYENDISELKYVENQDDTKQNQLKSQETYFDKISERRDAALIAC